MLRFRFFLLLCFVLLTASGGYSQISQSRFFIRFTDKNNSPYSLSNPSQFLSARAIQRRTNQAIAYNTLDLPVNPAYMDSLYAKGATVYARSKWHNGAIISVPDTATLTAILALPFIADTDQVRLPGKSDGRGKFETPVPANSVMKNSQAASVQSYSYGQSFQQIHIMHGEYLHNQGFHGEGMQIALLDNGFFTADQLTVFDSLFSQNRVLATWDFVNGETDVYNDGWHGESVLSCIAGNKPDTLVGTAPQASFYLLTTEDDNSENIIEEYNWAAGAEYADSAGADIISSSLGYTRFDSAGFTQDHTYADMNGNTCPSSIAADIAASKGILVLVAAGNEGASPWYYISAPSDGDSVLSVAAVGDSGWKAMFSSFGPSSDGDVKPNVASHGENTTVDWGGFTAQLSGTSFACPVLAGASACLWQKHPAKTNMEVFAAIEQSANYYLTPGDSLGYGIPNFEIADQILSIVRTDTKAAEGLVVYPNPVQDELRFLLCSPSAGEIQIEIFDMEGRRILDQNLNALAKYSTVVSLPGYMKNGMYLLRVSQAGKVYSRQFLKQ